MNRKDAMAWGLSVCITWLRLSQAKTSGELVEAAMRCPRISLQNIRRASGGGVASQMKRCWRFITNHRIEPSVVMPVAMSGVIQCWVTTILIRAIACRCEKTLRGTIQN